MSACAEILRTIMMGSRPQVCWVSPDLYNRAYKEIEESELGRTRGVLCTGYPWPNILIGGIPVCPLLQVE